jgi:hypothetical protein
VLILKTAHGVMMGSSKLSAKLSFKLSFTLDGSHACGTRQPSGVTDEPAVNSTRSRQLTQRSLNQLSTQPVFAQQ